MLWRNYFACRRTPDRAPWTGETPAPLPPASRKENSASRDAPKSVLWAGASRDFLSSGPRAYRRSEKRLIKCIASPPSYCMQPFQFSPRMHSPTTKTPVTSRGSRRTFPFLGTSASSANQYFVNETSTLAGCRRTSTCRNASHLTAKECRPERHSPSFMAFLTLSTLSHR